MNVCIKILIPLSLVTLTGCDPFTNDERAFTETQFTPKVIRLPREQNAADSELIAETGDGLAAISGTSKIPYPLYPNARQYRIGGEEGLKIVLFETEDPFYMVDAYYRRSIDKTGLSRLLAMSDYVRYAADDSDSGAWDTDMPGIVIHEFPNRDQAKELGAATTARTNIIMSF